jgi:hypothetical protein
MAEPSDTPAAASTEVTVLFTSGVGKPVARTAARVSSYLVLLHRSSEMKLSGNTHQQAISLFQHGTTQLRETRFRGSARRY